MRTCLLALSIVAVSAGSLHAEVKSRAISYRHGDVLLEGYFAWDDVVTGKRPAVLVVHEWWGLNDYARRRADQLARLGYAAFALDMYGKGVLAKHPSEAKGMAEKARANVKDWRDRATAGLDVLKAQPEVDASRVAAMGYCFGGSTVLQLAYSGADLKGVVTFHGAPSFPEAGDAERIKAKFLLCHGADDSFIPEDALEKLRHGLTQAKADWTMIYYSGARHSFTDPGADSHGVAGLKYDKQADTRSWQHLRDFLNEIFAKK